MHTVARRTIFDGLREQIMRNGAWKTPSMQSEVAPADNSFHAAMDTSGIGQAWTTSRSSRTHTGGDITPQVYTRPHAIAPMNINDQLADAGRAMNARAALPNRGISPLARRG